MSRPDYTNLLQLTLANEDLLKGWVRQRPSITKTYDDLLADVRAGNIKQHVHSEDSWKREAGKSFTPKQNVAAFYRGSGGAGEIHYPEGGEGSLPHELLHYFAGHKAGSAGTPERINPYMKLDMALGGWLPSLHPASRRPTLPGSNRFSNWWNENMATQQTEYSNDPKKTGIPFWKRSEDPSRAYHPWFDEHAYDSTADKMKENVLKYISDQEKTRKQHKTQQIQEKPVRYDKNMYPIFPKQSAKAQSFRDAFRDARRQGLDIFDWDNRKYTTELA